MSTQVIDTQLKKPSFNQKHKHTAKRVESLLNRAWNVIEATNYPDEGREVDEINEVCLLIYQAQEVLQKINPPKEDGA